LRTTDKYNSLLSFIEKKRKIQLLCLKLNITNLNLSLEFEEENLTVFVNKGSEGCYYVKNVKKILWKGRLGLDDDSDNMDNKHYFLPKKNPMY